MVCTTTRNGTELGRWWVHQNATTSKMWAGPIPAGSSFITKCFLRESNGGFFEDDATLATLNMTVMLVGTLNP
jgi:hypothetical protein